jgi:hypothetical protein
MTTAASLAAQVWDGSKQAVQALPAPLQAPQIWIEKVVADGGGPGVALGFWMVALAGLMAAAPIGMAFRALADRQTRVTGRGPPARWRTAIIWFLAAIASLAVFGLLFLGVLLWVSQGVPILRKTAIASDRHAVDNIRKEVDGRLLRRPLLERGNGNAVYCLRGINPFNGDH